MQRSRRNGSTVVICSRQIALRLVWQQMEMLLLQWLQRSAMSSSRALQQGFDRIGLCCTQQDPYRGGFVQLLMHCRQLWSWLAPGWCAVRETALLVVWPSFHFMPNSGLQLR